MRTKALLAVIPAILLIVGTVPAAAGHPWGDHEKPFDYLFDNHIDTHQESLAKKANLQGFFYITLTGAVDGASGLPKATHGDCSMQPEGCSVGWTLHGRPAAATLVDKQNGHPTWCVDADDLPRARGYTHFHWIDEAEHAGDLKVGDDYDGWLLRLTAVDSFFFEHHGGFAIRPGIDFESHANLDCNV